MRLALAALALSALPLSALAATETYYIHADHLNTPRLIKNHSQQVVWRWDNDDPFGGNMANANPSGLGAFEFNLRFPGQYFDKETNQHYNYYRDYSPEIGRYIESDPIGLGGGINTYAYVKSQSLSLQDPFGLEVKRCCRPAHILGGNVDHCWLQTNTVIAGMNSTPQCSIAGNDYEPLYATNVYVSDHSCDKPQSCGVINDVDEECVNRELHIGRSLGKFTVTNNCQSFVNNVISKCSKKRVPAWPSIHTLPAPKSR